MLLSKKSWLITIFKSSNLLFQNRAALIAERQFVTNQQLCRIKAPRRPPISDTPSPSREEPSESQRGLNSNRISRFTTLRADLNRCRRLHCVNACFHGRIREWLGRSKICRVCVEKSCMEKCLNIDCGLLELIHVAQSEIIDYYLCLFGD